MIANMVGLLVLVALVVLFGWLASRTWGAKRAFIKWPGVILSGLVTLVLAVVTVVAAIGLYRLNAPQSNPVANVKVAGTPEQIARGARFASFCTGCHSTAGQPPLDGSKDNFVEGGPPIGTLYGPNLTSGGDLKNWSDGQIIRAIREGVDKDGRSLIIMPSETLHNLSDADVQAIVAYLRSQPEVKRDVPQRDLNLIAALFMGAGMVPTSVQPPITQPVVAPPEGVTDAYGKYLVSVLGCHDCHGPDLAGIAPGGFGPPAGPNLTVLIPHWSEADFVKTIRTGVDASGHTLTEDMPWKDISAFATDDDLGAMYAYLKGLTPIVKAVK